MIRRSLLSVLVGGALLVAACGGGDDDTASSTTPSTVSESTAAPTTSAPTTTAPTTTAPASTTTEATTTTTTLPPIPRQPLTGEPLASGEEPIDRAALAVKIDNAPGARRNHSGLAVADLVYEEIVEGSITRFAAVFHSQGSEVVGPIRSGRSQDVDLLTSLRQPLFAWSGGNPGVQDLIADSTFVDLRPGKGNGYYRGAGSTPHNLYNDTETLWSQTPDGHPGAPPEQLPYYRPGGSFGGAAVEGFELTMRGIDVEWDWDAETGRFLRSQEGSAHVDRVHGRIGATNVVVLGVEYRPSQIDARSPEAQTVGTGPMWAFSEGGVIFGTWARDANDEVFTLTSEAGDPIAMAPGQTWIELAEQLESDDPANPGVEIVIAEAG
jgi:hypothetical protein